MEVAASQMENCDSRYAHLLKPIKDLAKNWNIDLADSLSNYLEELAHTTISFDGGITKMNFAQAALLVQSSACVYSKKVEYLYSLVFKVMDLVSNKKKQAQKSSVDSEGNDNDANFNDNDDEFLSLDDIQDGKNLYMKEDLEEGEKFELLPEIPLCLIPLEENEKGDNPLLSKKGEVLGSRKDFKLNTCHIHSSGTLLLDLSHLKLLENTLNQRVQTQDVEMGAPEEIRNVNEISVRDDDIQDDNLPVDHDVDDVHCDMNQQEPAIPMQESEEPDNNILCNKADRQAEAVIQNKKSTVKKPIIDPLQPIDAMEKLRPDKPLKINRNIVKVCPGIKGQTRKRKRKNTSIPEELEPVKDFITKRCFSHVLRFPKSASKDDLALEFEKLYWKEYKRRQSLNRDLLKQKRKANRQNSEEVEEGEEEEEEEVQIGQQFQGCDDIDVLENEEPLVDDNFFNAIEGITGDDDDDNLVHERNRSFSDDIDDALIVTSYEDLVRKHVEDYIASAGDFAQITDLSRRVSEWEDKIIPSLELEDTLDPFDINECGSCLLGGLAYKKSIKFSEIVQRKQVYEICRLFLASLMLANTENVKIKEIDSLEKGMDVFELELLSMRRHFEELQEYQAPSLG